MNKRDRNVTLTIDIHDTKIKLWFSWNTLIHMRKAPLLTIACIILGFQIKHRPEVMSDERNNSGWCVLKWLSQLRGFSCFLYTDHPLCGRQTPAWIYLNAMQGFNASIFIRHSFDKKSWHERSTQPTKQPFPFLKR